MCIPVIAAVYREVGRRIGCQCEFRNALARPAAVAAFNSYVGNGGPKP